VIYITAKAVTAVTASSLFKAKRKRPLQQPRWSAAGVVAKRRDKPYRSGRSPDWIKIKNPDAPAASRVIEG
jgi:ATP-dependent DNA ligase